MQSNVTFLTFDGEVEAAMDFYISLFEDSRVLNVTRYGPDAAGPEGTIEHATFVLQGKEYVAVDKAMMQASRDDMQRWEDNFPSPFEWMKRGAQELRSIEIDSEVIDDLNDTIEDLRDEGVTILLVTHLMEEAERLADRVALIDGGRLIALDTPAGLIARADDEQRIRFRPSAPLDDRELVDLPEVTGVSRVGDHLVVTGTGNVLHSITSHLARKQIIAEQLRVDTVTLDDAFVALTGRMLEDAEAN